MREKETMQQLGHLQKQLIAANEEGSVTRARLESIQEQMKGEATQTMLQLKAAEGEGAAMQRKTVELEAVNAALQARMEAAVAEGAAMQKEAAEQREQSEAAVASAESRLEAEAAQRAQEHAQELTALRQDVVAAREQAGRTEAEALGQAEELGSVRESLSAALEQGGMMRASIATQEADFAKVGGGPVTPWGNVIVGGNNMSMHVWGCRVTLWAVNA